MSPIPIVIPLEARVSGSASACGSGGRPARRASTDIIMGRRPAAARPIVSRPDARRRLHGTATTRVSARQPGRELRHHRRAAVGQAGAVPGEAWHNDAGKVWNSGKPNPEPKKPTPNSSVSRFDLHRSVFNSRTPKFSITE